MACVQAAELRAHDRQKEALRCIERIVELQPGNGRARFAAGQLHAGLRAWDAAELAYLAAAELEGHDAAQQARCWFGAGTLGLPIVPRMPRLSFQPVCLHICAACVHRCIKMCFLFCAGVAQHQQGDLDAALQSFERAGEQAVAALQDGHIAEPPLKGSDIERARRTAVRALMSQASIHKRLGRPDQAVTAARQAAQLDPAVQKHVTELEADARAAG